jgi:hypothetical protein
MAFVYPRLMCFRTSNQQPPRLLLPAVAAATRRAAAAHRVVTTTRSPPSLDKTFLSTDEKEKEEIMHAVGKAWNDLKMLISTTPIFLGSKVLLDSCLVLDTAACMAARVDARHAALYPVPTGLYIKENDIPATAYDRLLTEFVL